MIAVDGNGFAGHMTADAAGVVVSLFALGQLCAEYQDTATGDHFIEQYHRLLEFAREHEHTRQIFAAID